MAKQITIKEIARLTGVSPGTIDRILHNRGKVSQEKIERVKAVLDDAKYRPNIHTSAVSLKKGYNIAVCTPEYGVGEYWSILNSGIKKALEEYADVNIVCENISYNQFDIKSYGRACDSIIRQKPDAVLLGPMFEQKTRDLCAELDDMQIPYAFVDSTIDGTSPKASFMADQPVGGKILCEMLMNLIDPGKKIALLKPYQAGSEHSYNYDQRVKGLIECLSNLGAADRVLDVSFDMDDIRNAPEMVSSLVRTNPDIKGIAILNSRGYMVADALADNGIEDVKVASFDLTYNNARCLKNGSISLILSQRPMTQGFYAVKAIIEYLMYGQQTNKFMKMPIDIIVKDNLPYYIDLLI